MRMVGIQCNLLLDDDTATWVEELLSSDSLPSELAYYLTQRKSGGYIVRADELDEIVDDVVGDVDDISQRDTIEEAVKNAITELLTSGTFNIGTQQVVQSDQPTNRVEIPDEEEREPEVISFVSDGESSEEDMSDDEVDDLADFFGF